MDLETNMWNKDCNMGQAIFMEHAVSSSVQLVSDLAEELVRAADFLGLQLQPRRLQCTLKYRYECKTLVIWNLMFNLRELHL